MHYISFSIWFSFLLVTLVDALRGTSKIVSKVIKGDPIEISEQSAAAPNAINCEEFKLILFHFKQVYIKALQIESVARGYQDKIDGEPFSPEKSLLHELFKSMHIIDKYHDINITLSKTVLDSGEECPSEQQIKEARQLNGNLSYIHTYKMSKNYLNVL